MFRVSTCAYTKFSERLGGGCILDPLITRNILQNLLRYRQQIFVRRKLYRLHTNPLQRISKHLCATVERSLKFGSFHMKSARVILNKIDHMKSTNIYSLSAHELIGRRAQKSWRPLLLSLSLSLTISFHCVENIKLYRFLGPESCP